MIYKMLLTLLSHCSFEEYNSAFNVQSRNVVEQYAPMITWKKKSGEPDWLDGEYVRSRALRRKLEKVWKKHKTKENMEKYIHQKKLCMDMALQKQSSYYSRLVEGAGSSQRSLFNIANKLLDKNEDRVLPAHTDSSKLATEFNNFYVDKVKKIRSAIPAVTSNNKHYSRPFSGKRLHDFEPTTVEEISEIIKEFGVKTSVEDPIPAALIKS